MRAAALIVPCVLLPLLPAFGQAVYKCTGENGHVTYSSVPCTADPSAHVVRITENVVTSSPPQRPQQAQGPARGPAQGLAPPEPQPRIGALGRAPAVTREARIQAAECDLARQKEDFAVKQARECKGQSSVCDSLQRQVKLKHELNVLRACGQ